MRLGVHYGLWSSKRGRDDNGLRPGRFVRLPNEEDKVNLAPCQLIIGCTILQSLIT